MHGVHGLDNGAHRRRQSRRPYRRQLRSGRRLAVVRAFTAARLYLAGAAPSLAAAAESCGSTTVYVRHAVILLRSENRSLCDAALGGRVPLHVAAQQLKRLGELVAAYRQASAADRVAFAKAIGPNVLFDTSLVPAL